MLKINSALRLYEKQLFL